MNVKSQVLRIFIISILLGMVVNIYYSRYLSFSPVKSRNVVNVNPENSISEMTRIMHLQGIQCENLSYTEHDLIELKRYWKMINDYQLFHDDGIRKLNSGKSSDVRTLTWHCTDSYDCDGLGHRVNGITAFLLLAIASNRVLLLKWDKISIENVYLLPNMIDWRYPNHSLDGSFEDLGRFFSGKNLKPKAIIDPLAGNKNHISMLFNRLGSINKYINELNMKQNNTPSKPIDVHLFRIVSFMALFKISKELQLFGDTVRMKLNLHRQRYVALHIRTGHIEKNIERVRFMSTNNDAKTAVECAMRQANRHIGPNSIIVVVSDSGSLKQNLANTYSRVKILNNTIIHSEKAKNLDSSGMLGIWQDIIIMAEAHIVIYHMSTFPEMSIAMCGLPKERIVDLEYC